MWSLWLPLAFIAPCLWALVSLLDLYLVRGLYRDEWDGTLIIGAFQPFLWLLVAFGVLSFAPLPKDALLFALTGGAMFLASFFFYFRALFRFADSPLVHVLWNVAVLVVPFLAWAWSGERLQPVHYLGIALAFVGSSLFAARQGLLRRGFMRVAGTMAWAVLLLSTSMVLQKEAYRYANDRFFDVFLIFSLGAMAAATALAALNPKATMARIRRFAGFEARYIALLLFAEGLSFAGTVFSQRALDLSPSPSFVVAVESSVPVFVMLFSLVLAGTFARLGREQASTLFRNQMLGWPEKLMAMALMSSGIYCIAGQAGDEAEIHQNEIEVRGFSGGDSTARGYFEKAVTDDVALALSAFKTRGWDELTLGPTLYLSPEMSVGAGFGASRYAAGGASGKSAHRTTSAFWFWKSDAWEAEVLVERYARDPAPWYAEGYVQKWIGDRLSLGVFAQKDSGWGPRLSYAIDGNIEVWASLLAKRTGDSAAIVGVRVSF